MAVAEKKIVIWCGSAPNQKALINKIAKQHQIAGIVIDQKPGGNKKRRLSKILSLVVDRLRFYTIYKAWKDLMKFYDDRFPHWPSVPILKTGSINTIQSVQFTEAFSPDLIIVSGTALIKEPLLNTKATIGIINLHTGLSPYVKGGPNCTNWCIAENTWEYVGNTIMWLNAGIDSGNILATETIDIRNETSLKNAHIKVMEHAHDLYLRSIQYLLTSSTPFQSVPQRTITKGRLYLNKMWNAEKKSQLMRNWKNRKSIIPGSSPLTIPLPFNEHNHA